MSDQLKPCPFCGGEAEFVDAQHATVGVDTVWCTSCGCRMVGKKCREQWSSRPSFVVPSVETIRRLIMTEFIRAEDGADLSDLAYVQADAIHSHLLASGARESVAWEALEILSNYKTTINVGPSGLIRQINELQDIARTALATRKEGA